MSRTRVVPLAAQRRIVECATRAPSVHNTQPWRWRAGPDRLELLADPDRRLAETDPDGRNLVISCGAALHHAQVVAGALGWAPEVTRHPDPTQPDLLARLDLSPGDAAADGSGGARASSTSGAPTGAGSRRGRSPTSGSTTSRRSRASGARRGVR